MGKLLQVNKKGQMYFFDSSEFEFLQIIQNNWKAIKSEFDQVEHRFIHPWPERNLYQLESGRSLKPGEGWTVFGLYAFGKRRDEACQLCPFTDSILRSLPEPPQTAAFSCLAPGAHILPHSGYFGYSSRVLRAHLALQVPQDHRPIDLPQIATNLWEVEFENSVDRTGCCLRVEDQVSTWEEGDIVVFDDSYIHEAWNYCATRRIVLLLDFNRPERFMRPEMPGDLATDKGDEYLDQLTSEFGYDV